MIITKKGGWLYPTFFVALNVIPRAALRVRASRESKTSFGQSNLCEAQYVIKALNIP